MLSVISFWTGFTGLTGFYLATKSTKITKFYNWGKSPRPPAAKPQLKHLCSRPWKANAWREAPIILRKRRCTCGEAARLPDERSEEPCEIRLSRSDQVARGQRPSREAYPPTVGRCRRQSLEWCRKRPSKVARGCAPRRLCWSVVHSSQ